MPQTIVNLALPVVTEKIDEVLISYPGHLYQQTFASLEMRQKLTAYVLSRIPGFYVTMEHATACSLESPRNCYSAEQHQQIEHLIRQGIEHLSRPGISPDYPRLTEWAETPFAPSSWFG